MGQGTFSQCCMFVDKLGDNLFETHQWNLLKSIGHKLRPANIVVDLYRSFFHRSPRKWTSILLSPIFLVFQFSGIVNGVSIEIITTWKLDSTARKSLACTSFSRARAKALRMICMRLSMGVPVSNRDAYLARAALSLQKAITWELADQLVVASVVS